MGWWMRLPGVLKMGVLADVCMWSIGQARAELQGMSQLVEVPVAHWGRLIQQLGRREWYASLLVLAQVSALH